VLAADAASHSSQPTSCCARSRLRRRPCASRPEATQALIEVLHGEVQLA
jgi:hypothetical protein